MLAEQLPNGRYLVSRASEVEGRADVDEVVEIGPEDREYDAWTEWFARRSLVAYSETQARDERGRWTDGDSAIPEPVPTTITNWSTSELQQVGVDSVIHTDGGTAVFGHKPDGPPDIMNSTDPQYEAAREAGAAYQTYGELNDVMRGDMHHEMIRPEHNDQIDALEAAAAPLTEDVTAFRLYNAPPDSELRDWLTTKNTIIQDAGFLSTSTSPNLGGVQLREEERSENRVWMAIDVPAGSDVVWLNGDNRLGVDKQDNYGEAPYEMLLMSGHPIEIIGDPVQNTNGELVVHGRALNPGWEGYYVYGDERAPQVPQI